MPESKMKADPEGQRAVILIRDSREVSAIVEDTDRAPWRVFEFSTAGKGAEIDWNVIVYLPSDEESMPLIFVFESREVARRWSERDERAHGYDWQFLDEPEEQDEAGSTPSGARARSRATPAVAHHPALSPLTLYDKPGLGEPHYDVPPVGVSDWSGRTPGSAQVPPGWRPSSFRSHGQSHMTGHEPRDPPRTKTCAPKGNQSDNLPFSILDTAYPF
jgi:hypothetical protein